MTDQGFGQSRSLVDQRERVTSRFVPIGPKAVGATETVIAVVPSQQLMKVGQLAVCNPTASAISLELYVTPDGGTQIAQIVGMSIAANTSVDLTKMIGGLYLPNATMSAKGQGLILSGWHEAIL